MSEHTVTASHDAATDAHASAGDHGHGNSHVVPMPILLGVWLALMVFTVLTVAVTYVDLGSLNLWIALAIATVKASLVALFFMHLRWDRPMNGIILIGSLVFVMLLVGLALMDTAEYKPDLIEGYAPYMDLP
jgi:cytochrome c oxidase subunit 4